MKFALALCLCAGLAQAQEAIRSDGPLSDDDFYRLVSCAAPIAGGCQKDLVRWSPADARDVSVAFGDVAADYPEALRSLADAALDKAIAEVNAAGANIRLTRHDHATKPDITIYLLAVTMGNKITGTGLDPLDGTQVDAARTQIWWRADRSLIMAAIVIAKDISPQDLPSIMLEEVIQSLGLLTDIDGDYHQSRSIFSETSNQLTRLGPQDIMVLKRHYP